MTPDACRSLFASQPVARLATIGGGKPHIVPIVFAVDGDRIVTAVDHKPKASTRLRRLANVEENQAVAVLADEYRPDWEQLWWVRIDGTAQVTREGPSHAAAIDLLAAKYPQYRARRPKGPVIEIAVERWTGWTASE